MTLILTDIYLFIHNDSLTHYLQRAVFLLGLFFSSSAVVHADMSLHAGPPVLFFNRREIVVVEKTKSTNMCRQVLFQIIFSSFVYCVYYAQLKRKVLYNDVGLH